MSSGRSVSIAWPIAFGLLSGLVRHWGRLFTCCQTVSKEGFRHVKQNPFGFGFGIRPGIGVFEWWGPAWTSHSTVSTLSLLGFPTATLRAWAWFVAGQTRRFRVRRSVGRLVLLFPLPVDFRRVVPCQSLVWRWLTGCWIGGSVAWKRGWTYAHLSMTGGFCFGMRLPSNVSGQLLSSLQATWIWLLTCQRLAFGPLTQMPGVVCVAGMWLLH